jgi:hypothetical protein
VIDALNFQHSDHEQGRLLALTTENLQQGLTTENLDKTLKSLGVSVKMHVVDDLHPQPQT